MGLLQRLSSVKSLPTLPSVVLQIQQLTSSQESDARALAEVIEHDSALTTKILKTANSVFFTPSNQRISSVQLAVPRLGYEEVRNLALAIGIIRKFPGEQKTLNHTFFWHHSLAAAYLAQEIARIIHPKDFAQHSSHYFLAGLLHDIGILVFDQFFHDEFSKIMEVSADRIIPFLEAEEINFAHERHFALGAALLETWRINTEVISGVRFHHLPDRAPQRDQETAWAIHLAEFLLCNNTISSFEGSVKGDLRIICGKVGIDTAKAGELVSWANAEARKYDALLKAARGRETDLLRKV